MVTLQRKIEPEVCEYFDVDENSLTIEIVLPGVLKENIRLKVNVCSLQLYATSEEANYAKYLFFDHPVEPLRGKAIYEHGILRVKIPLRA